MNAYPSMIVIYKMCTPEIETSMNVVLTRIVRIADA